MASLRSSEAVLVAPLVELEVTRPHQCESATWAVCAGYNCVGHTYVGHNCTGAHACLHTCLYTSHAHVRTYAYSYAHMHVCTHA